MNAWRNNESIIPSPPELLGALAFIIALICFVGASAHGQTNEVEWVDEIAKSLPFAEVEVRLPNGRRCDLVYGDYACEVDWTPKQFEAIGQSLHYSIWLGKKPAVLLLIKDANYEADVSDCKLTCERAGIALWIFDTRKREWMVKP